MSFILLSPSGLFRTHSSHGDGKGTPRGKPNHISTFPAAFCITTANILLTKVKHMAEPKVKRQEVCTTFSGENAKLNYKTKDMNTGNDEELGPIIQSTRHLHKDTD